MNLRPYQQDDYDLYKKLSKVHQHILFGGSTGFGKSAVIYNLIKDELAKGGRVVVILPRRKLVHQIKNTLLDFSPSIIMGSDTQYNKNSPLFIASTPTLHNKLKKHGRGYLGGITLVIVDECHINHLSTCMELLRKHYWDSSQWVGLSATPLDKSGYRLEGYDYTLYEHQSQDLIELGYLTPIRVLVEDTPQGLENISLTGGDYNELELSKFMSDSARVGNVYAMWEKYCSDRKTLIFAVSISHAEIIHTEFKKHNVKIGLVHSKIDEKYENVTLQNFRDNKLDVIVNVGKLTTGFDEGSITAMITTQPSRSLRLVLQCAGRATRLHTPLDDILKNVEGRVALIPSRAIDFETIKRQAKNVAVFLTEAEAVGYDKVITNVYPNKEDAIMLDLAGVVAQHGYPTMRRDFNKVRPPKGVSAADLVEFKDIICPFCKYSTQFRNCRKEVLETKSHVTRRTYCPNCNEIIKEDVTETKEIERLRLIEDYTNTKKVTDKMVGEFVVRLQKNRDYKNGWTNHIAHKYNTNKEFKEALKILHNKFEAKLINIETATNNLMKL